MNQQKHNWSTVYYTACYNEILYTKNEISLNNNDYISYILYHILYSFLDKDLLPDGGLMKSAETCSSAVGRGRADWLARPRPTALLSPSSDGKPEAATAVVVAPDDGHEDTRNMLSCI